MKNKSNIKQRRNNMEKNNPTNLVVKSNDLIISRYNLSLAEQRLILQVISMIDKDDEDFKDYYVSISGYLNLIGNNSNNYYQIKKFVEELLKKPLHIPLQNGNFLICNWFSSIVYLSEKGTLVCRFDPHLKPYLLQLKNHFTSYRLENILKLKSKYSIRLYEVLKRYEKIKEIKIPLDNLREYLSIPKTYKYNDIRKQILQPSLEDLKEYTDIIFDYYEIKDGKKVAKLKFVIYLNKRNITDTDHENDKCLYEEPVNTLNDDLEVLIKALPEAERTKSIEAYLSKCLQTYDAKYLLHQIKYVVEQKPKNFIAYLKKAIEEDYAKTEIAEEKEKAEKEKIERLVREKLEELEKEKKHNIDVFISKEKLRIYSDFMNALNDNEKQDLIQKYKVKVKEMYPDLDENKNPFLFKVKLEYLITEDIIAENKIYQIRLERASKEAKEIAEREFQREKQKLNL